MSREVPESPEVILERLSRAVKNLDDEGKQGYMSDDGYDDFAAAKQDAIDAGIPFEERHKAEQRDLDR